jgi:hypothetical protein
MNSVNSYVSTQIPEGHYTSAPIQDNPYTSALITPKEAVEARDLRDKSVRVIKQGEQPKDLSETEEFVSIDLNPSHMNKQTEEQSNRTCSVFSRTLKHIREFFHSIETRISSSIEKLQIERQEERIRHLELKSTFLFEVKNIDPKVKGSIHEALVKASLSNSSKNIHIDESGKLCEPQNSVLSITFLHKQKKFLPYPGPKAPHGFQVNGKPIELNNPSESYQNDECFLLTDEKRKEIISIKTFKKNEIIKRKQEIITELKLKSDFCFNVHTETGSYIGSHEIQEALFKASLTKSPVHVYINKFGDLCESPKNSVLDILFRSSHKDFIISPGPKANSDFYLVNDKPIHSLSTEEQEEMGMSRSFKLSDKKGRKIFAITIGIRNTERAHKAFRENHFALEAARKENMEALRFTLLSARFNSQQSEIFHIDSYGKICRPYEAEAQIVYNFDTKNFSVLPIPGRNFRLNYQEIGKQGINFQDGGNHFSSDTNPIGFTVNIPLITEEAKIIERSGRFLKALTELREKKASDRIYIDENGNLCDQGKARIKIVHEDLATFIASPTFSENNSWIINGRPTGKNGVRFNMRQPTSFIREEKVKEEIKEKEIFSIHKALNNLHPVGEVNKELLLPYEEINH